MTTVSGKCENVYRSGTATFESFYKCPCMVCVNGMNTNRRTCVLRGSPLVRGRHVSSLPKDVRGALRGARATCSQVEICRRSCRRRGCRRTRRRHQDVGQNRRECLPWSSVTDCVNAPSTTTSSAGLRWRCFVFPKPCLSVTCVLFSLLRSEAHVGWDGLLRVTNVYA